ncbi:MAG: SDR family NAD(P)-dependent oxidoreductase, partial [Actinomyces sp.]
NLWGVVHGLRAFLPAMIARGEGHVVNTASIAGHVCSPGMGPYNASKFAVVAISETLHQEMLRDGTGVGVTCLCPGFVATDILDSERNRPEPLLDATPPGSGLDEQTRAAVADAYAAQLDPAVVAELVLDAVRAGAFWVFTDDVFDDLVAARHAEIRERRTPPLHPHIAERLLAP